jgi:exoribonuclease R|uniref:RNB domain-containing protein n=1 Tax=viral metagenome TaxID=1070528 RepID=A0A6C0IQ33_9ZZZZ
MNFKVKVEDRQYSTFEYLDTKTLRKSDHVFDKSPLEMKLFNQDIIDEDYNVLHSSVRAMRFIPGVLILSDGKTYGRSGGMVTRPYFYYRCIPDDRRLPEFLVSFRIKDDFSKYTVNKYIVFRFKDWVQKHPVATCENSLGNVTELPNFYEYQLYCKSLYASIQLFKKDTYRKLKEENIETYIGMIFWKNEIEDRTDKHIYSIDPTNSKDFDDAFGIQMCNDKDYYILSIYISNVSFWLDVLDLWESFSKRISTIYLPDRKRPMLPTILSDAICSLVEGEKKFAFTLDLHINKEREEIVKYNFVNTMINVKKNYRYDTNELDNPDVKLAFLSVKNLNKYYKYVDRIENTHDMIAYMMIMMNYYCARFLKMEKTGLFRSAKINQAYDPPEHVPQEINKFLKLWHSFGGQYCDYKNFESHDLLELDAYVHITSPIRRLPDLLNIIIIQDKMGLVSLKGNRKTFLEGWMKPESIEYINQTMRSIRRVQNDCNLLDLCSKDDTIKDKVFEAFVFDKIVRNDALYQYMVFMPEFKMTNRFTSRHDIELYSKQNFKVYVFMDEIRLKQKIRIEIQLEE